MARLDVFDRLTSSAASAARAGSGDRVSRVGPRPALPLRLWEFEACPYCRKVREAISTLDLDAMIHPCPKRGTRFRPEAKARGGRAKFPYLVDPNAGDRALYESDTIVSYLFDSYGDGRPTRALRLGPITTVSSALASALRGRHGLVARPSRAPAEPLELWAYEASPGCRLVRETMCELELPYLLRTLAHGSAKRGEFRARWGEVEVPFLHDPNHGVSTYGHVAIREHLERAYAIAR